MTALVVLAVLSVIALLVWGMRRSLARPLPPADRFAALETDHARECLAALTEADVEWLKWWGWEPTPEVAERIGRAKHLRAQAETWKRIEEKRKREAVTAAEGRLTNAVSNFAATFTQEERIAETPARLIAAGLSNHGGPILPGSPESRVNPFAPESPYKDFGIKIIHGVPHRILKQNDRVYALPISTSR